ncbi:alpha/beta hydrolase [Inhella proteolytica]|uniref:Alpha/beta hydrolase n=1 Tax=Inhella proteolytica TaxID=2795029 RepID=A0A931J1Y7_9BURK|nr:alpha/beta hydrolase [Inhella proteolytica]MBH9577238.1 alpha/beta hydrolase [Inhella proteolytica]
MARWICPQAFCAVAGQVPPMSSVRERATVWLQTQIGRWVFRPSRPMQDIRAQYERLSTVSRAKLKARYPAISFADHDLGGVPAESTCSLAEPQRLLMHLHGGVYFFGSAASFRARANNLSFRCRAQVFMPEYRLAPEHPFPAAFEDVKRAWRALAALHPGAALTLSGDSAGGGLALALMMAMRDEGGPLPERCFVISPWTDLSCSGTSVETNRRLDWFGRQHAEAWVPQILAGADATDPRISPLFGRFEGLPPLLFVVGGHEVILDDTRRCVAKARAAGVAVQELIGAGMLHDYPLALPKLAESQRAWRAIAEFCRA